MKILPIIMAGGVGSRLWPLSRKDYPKQFLRLVNQDSLLQNTLTRLKGLDTLAPLIICNEEHRFFVASQLAEKGISPAGILLEPAGRNTAPALALASLYTKVHHQDPILLVLSADHSIQDLNAFHQAIRQGEALAKMDKLVTFGVIPTIPHTGYGYIKKGKPLSPTGFAVAQFVEKPNYIKATSYLQSGEYYWNSGIFMFKAHTFLQELAQYSPDILTTCQKAFAMPQQDGEFIRIDKDTFCQCPSESIDYAVMEHTKDAVVIPLSSPWSDVGSWQAMWEISPKDTQGNHLKGDVVAVESQNCLISAEEGLVATLGIKDLVVIATKDATLIAPKDRSQQLSLLLNHLKTQQHSAFEHHLTRYRPWGTSEALVAGEDYQVRKVIVKPKGKISLQRHKYRSEHWIVVAGVAHIQAGENSLALYPNQSTYIPAGIWHSVENNEERDLIFIEVQSGQCQEDDIERA